MLKYNVELILKNAPSEQPSMSCQQPCGRQSMRQNAVEQEIT